MLPRSLVLLVCALIAGLAVSGPAGAALPSDPGAGFDAAVQSVRGGQVDDDQVMQSAAGALQRAEERVETGALPNEVSSSSGATISAPSFSRQRKRCRRIRSSQRRKSCLRRVTKRQKRWQRAHRVRKMTFAVAKANTLAVAEYVYLDPEVDWDGYDAGACERLSRTSVRCLFMVWEEIYSETGSYIDTIICGDYVTTSYDRRNRLKTRIAGDAVCVRDSEI